MKLCRRWFTTSPEQPTGKKRQVRIVQGHVVNAPFKSSEHAKRELYRSRLQQFAEKNSFKSHQDWYKVSVEQLQADGHHRLLTEFGDSLFSLLKFAFPEEKWKAWIFPDKVPPKYWNCESNQKLFVESIAEELNIKSHQPEDWTRVTLQYMLQKGGQGLLAKYDNSPLKLFSTLYPDANWKDVFGKSLLNRKKTQMLLHSYVAELFPNETVVSNYKYHHKDCANPLSILGITRRPMELDVYVPSLNLALEYQGEHHYQPVHYAQTPTSVYQARDEEKKAAVRSLGITLVEIPYWWDKSKESLAATISHFRPDLHLPTSAQPISLDMPESSKKIAGIEMMLAQNYNNEDPTDWWMTEKYDGIRAYWNGSMFVSRNFLPLQIPQEILNQMPKEHLEGEIWFGYNTGQEAMKIVKKAATIPWQNFQYLIFDAPKHAGPLEDRFAFLHSIVSSDHKFLKVVPKTKCQGKNHLQKYLKEITSRGGEGVILRQPQSFHYAGRSKSVLKVKNYEDSDAVILEANQDSNLYECQTSNGVKFLCLARSALRGKLKVGDVVRFQHSGFFVNGRPRQPWIIDIREDLDGSGFVDQ